MDKYPYPDGCCQVCGGEPEECAELDDHTWIPCRECGQDMRPQYGECIDCHVSLPAVIRLNVRPGSEVAQRRRGLDHPGQSQTNSGSWG